jgi:hypothetical protein
MSLAFDRTTGFLTRLGAAGVTSSRGRNGVLLWDGLARTPMASATASGWISSKDRLSFDQRFGGLVTLRHELATKGPSLVWQVTFRNLTDRGLWLEALLSLPVPLRRVREYFDMSDVQDQLALPRRRDTCIFSLPFAAAVGGGRHVGAGLDPHADVSALVSEWVAEGGTGTLRQGTRVVLDSRGAYALHLRVVKGAAHTGALDAVAGYHALFPDLYRHDPAVPIYSYMPIARYFEEIPAPDLARQCHVGMQWGHGPELGKGDEWGTQRY